MAVNLPAPPAPANLTTGRVAVPASVPSPHASASFDASLLRVGAHATARAEPGDVENEPPPPSSDGPAAA